MCAHGGGRVTLYLDGLIDLIVGVRVPKVRYERSPATLPPEIADDGAVLSGPSYSPAIARSLT